MSKEEASFYLEALNLSLNAHSQLDWLEMPTINVQPFGLLIFCYILEECKKIIVGEQDIDYAAWIIFTQVCKSHSHMRQFDLV